MSSTMSPKLSTLIIPLLLLVACIGGGVIGKCFAKKTSRAEKTVRLSPVEFYKMAKGITDAIQQENNNHSWKKCRYVVTGDLSLDQDRYFHLKNLPEQLTVKGSLIINSLANLSELPEKLVVAKSLAIKDCSGLQHLKSITVTEKLIIIGCEQLAPDFKEKLSKGTLPAAYAIKDCEGIADTNVGVDDAETAYNAITERVTDGS